MKESLLGFQLRIIPNKIEPWSHDRKKEYLLCEDVNIPLSVDTAVWPESDDQKLFSQLFLDHSAESNFSPNGLSVYTVVDNSALSHSSIYGNSFLIGITVAELNNKIAKNLKSNHCINDISFSTEHLNDLGWSRLGYDVADYWLKSGLMNCGYTHTNKSDLIKTFFHDSGLNKFGLIEKTFAAIAFSKNCNLRVPEHSPFAVFGIWENGIQDIDA